MSGFADSAASLLWASFKVAGMLEVATITSASVTADYDVGFTQPTGERFGGGHATQEYSIEYKAVDMPTLAEGDAVTIKSVAYRVRSAPFVDLTQGTAADGTFKRVSLTRI